MTPTLSNRLNGINLDVARAEPSDDREGQLSEWCSCGEPFIAMEIEQEVETPEYGALVRWNPFPIVAECAVGHRRSCSDAVSYDDGVYRFKTFASLDTQA